MRVACARLSQRLYIEERVYMLLATAVMAGFDIFNHELTATHTARNGNL